MKDLRDSNDLTVHWTGALWAFYSFFGWAEQVRGHYIAHLDPLNINSANIHMEELDALPGFLDYRKFGAPSPGTLIQNMKFERKQSDLIMFDLI
jgi:hypothetical protein